MVTQIKVYYRPSHKVPGTHEWAYITHAQGDRLVKDVTVNLYFDLLRVTGHLGPCAANPVVERTPGVWFFLIPITAKAALDGIVRLMNAYNYNH